MPRTVVASVMVGLAFGLLAAASAFVVAFREYRRHFPGWRRPVRMALQTAVVAFLFFFVASMLLPWLFRTYAGLK